MVSIEDAPWLRSVGHTPCLTLGTCWHFREYGKESYGLTLGGKATVSGYGDKIIFIPRNVYWNVNRIAIHHLNASVTVRYASVAAHLMRKDALKHCICATTGISSELTASIFAPSDPACASSLEATSGECDPYAARLRVVYCLSIFDRCYAYLNSLDVLRLPPCGQKGTVLRNQKITLKSSPYPHIAAWEASFLSQPFENLAA